MKNHLNATFEIIPTKSRIRQFNGYHRMDQTYLYQQVVGFTCIHCKREISSDPVVSGLNNRNHCPYCLHSRHVDLDKAGDRLNACKGDLEPIGLAWKKSHKKYGSGANELMVIHQCKDCQRFSVNRIAADDRTDLLEDLYRKTLHLPESLLALLKAASIQPVYEENTIEALACLFGKAYL